MKTIKISSFLMLFVLLAVIGTSCAPSTASTPAEVTVVVAGTPVVKEVVVTATPAQEGKEYKAAILLPGSIQDGSYNTLGMVAMQQATDKYGIKTGYSESVAVADVERVAREYIGSGYNIIIMHGAQYVTAMQNLSKEFPDVSFVLASGGEMEGLPPNVWNLGRKYNMGEYPLGVAAAYLTKTKKVAYLGGVTIGVHIAAANAICDAVKATDPAVEFLDTWIGDQNDPVKARQTAETMIADGVDVIFSGVDLGVYGLIEAARAAPHPVYLTTTTTDKHDLAPNIFITSVLFEYPKVYVDIIGKIIEGEPGGYYEMKPGSGISLAPWYNVPDEGVAAANEAFKQIAEGKLEVRDKTDVVECK